MRESPKTDLKRRRYGLLNADRTHLEIHFENRVEKDKNRARYVRDLVPAAHHGGSPEVVLEIGRGGRRSRMVHRTKVTRRLDRFGPLLSVTPYVGLYCLEKREFREFSYDP